MAYHTEKSTKTKVYFMVGWLVDILDCLVKFISLRLADYHFRFCLQANK